jgi:PAS domain S-box-containing protein
MRKSAAPRKKKHIQRSTKPAPRELVQAKKALERKTEELALSLSMMQATLDSTTDAIVVTDLGGNVRNFNQKYAEMMGVTRAQLNKVDINELRKKFSQRFKDPEQFMTRVREIYATTPAESFEVLELKDGSILERYSKIQSVDQRRVGRVWSFRDITERKRGEEKLHAAKSEAERASKAKDDFLALLSHELRTPLTPALAAASYMAEHENLPAEFREEVNVLLRNVQLEARLIDDLLDVTRIARGKIELCRETVDGHSLLRDALEITRRGMREKQIELKMQLDATNHYVSADPVRIRQVLWNILNNAVKFTNPGGRITVRTFDEKKRLGIEINDTGIGIEAEKQHDIFDAFEQGERSITRQFGGLGLGLAISKTLVDLHGGKISVESKGKDRGATFRVILNAVVAPAIAASTSNGGEPGKERSLQVLIVDDHADTREILSRLLTRCGHKVATVDCAHGALNFLDSRRFDALISDIGLPDSTGYELVRQAKQRQPVKGIALSGFGTEQDVRRSREAGFDYHLTKPVTFQDLRKLLQKITE